MCLPHQSDYTRGLPKTSLGSSPSHNLSHHPLLFLPTAQITAGYFMSLQLISPNASAMREGGPASLEHGFIQNAQRNAAA